MPSASASSSIACSNDRSALHHAGCPERVLGAKVRLRRRTSSRERPRSGTACGRGSRTGICQPPWPAPTTASASIAVSVPSRRCAEADGLPRRATAPAVELLGVAVVDEPHRPAGDPRELGCSQALEAGDRLGAEAPADELCENPDVVLAEPERRRELVPAREDSLRRNPRRQPVAVPRGNGAVRLERRLHVCRRVDARARSSRLRQRALPRRRPWHRRTGRTGSAAR